MKRVMMPFEYVTKAMVPDRLTDGADPWYKMFAQRYRTAQGYWRGNHEGEFRMDPVAEHNNHSFPKKQGNITRSSLTLFYEGVVKFLLAHIADQSEALASISEDLNRSKRASESAIAERDTMNDKFTMSEEEVKALRWVIVSLSKSAPTDPREYEW